MKAHPTLTEEELKKVYELSLEVTNQLPDLEKFREFLEEAKKKQLLKTKKDGQ